MIVYAPTLFWMANREPNPVLGRDSELISEICQENGGVRDGRGMGLAALMKEDAREPGA